MNINLTNGSGSHPMEPDDCNLQDDIEEHQAVLRSTGDWDLTGTIILMSEDPTEYPGSYQVWHEFYENGERAWVYINPDGAAVVTDCPSGHPQA